MLNKKNISLVFFIIAVSSLFLGFYRNQWRIVLPGRFREFQKDSQSLVMGRLTVSRQSGLFAYAGLLGRVDVDPYATTDVIDDVQYDTYLKEMNYSTYSVYFSQSGAQGFIFGIIDNLSPFSALENMRIFRVVASALLAFVLAYFLTWTLTEFGPLPALIALITTIASPWLTVFGRNLFYITAFFYLPLVGLLFYMAKNNQHEKRTNRGVALVVFWTVLLKCLFNGYDFVLPSLGAVVVPFVYYAVRDSWNFKHFFQKGLYIAGGMVTGVVVSLTILAIQISIVLGSFNSAVGYLSDTFSRRTLGDPEKFPEYASSLKVSVWEVLKIYFEGGEVLGQLSIRFYQVILAFLLFTLIYFAQRNKLKDFTNIQKSGDALSAATWASFIIPLLWFSIFKGQSYVHPHTNFLSWYMPFTILGFTMCGAVIQQWIYLLRRSV
jgi:hypothetical protein